MNALAKGSRSARRGSGTREGEIAERGEEERKTSARAHSRTVGASLPSKRSSPLRPLALEYRLLTYLPPDVSPYLPVPLLPTSYLPAPILRPGVSLRRRESHHAPRPSSEARSPGGRQAAGSSRPAEDHRQSASKHVMRLEHRGLCWQKAPANRNLNV
eukprot:1896340-Rhodomonas_salina.1